MISIIRFLFNQEDSLFSMFLVFELLETITIFFCIVYFFLKYYLDRENEKFFKTLSDFSKKLSLRRKIAFFFFILTVAIPNKVIVNNESTLIYQIITNFLMMILSSIFPLFIFIFAVRLKFAFESYIFAYVCSYTPWLRVIIVRYLFNGDDGLATTIFAFFWGNMVSAAKTMARGVGVATVGVAAYKVIKVSEAKNIETETVARTKRDWDLLMSDPRRAETTQQEAGVTAVAELENVKSIAKEEAIQTTTVTAFEHNFQKTSLAALDVFMKKYG